MDVMKQGSDRTEVTPGFQSKAMSALLKCVCILCCGKIASETGIAAWEDHKAGVLSHLSVLWLSGNWCWLPIRRASSRCRKPWDRSCWVTRAGERRWPWRPSAWILSALETLCCPARRLVQIDFIATLNTYSSIWNFPFQIYLRYMHFPKY